MATVPQTAPPLIGRDRELAILESALDRAREHHGRALILDGRPGSARCALRSSCVRGRKRQAANALP
jgi:predicted ATPase